MKAPDNRIHLVFALIFISSLITFSIQFYLPILYVDLGFDPIQIGFLVSLSFITHLFLGTPVGIFCDRYDIRKIVLIALILWLIFFYGMISASDIFIVTILILFFRSANFITRTSFNNIILKIKEKSKNKLIGHFMFFTYLGVVMGLLLGGYALFEFGFQNLFFFMFLLILVLIVASFFLPKIKYSRTRLKDYAMDLYDKRILILSIVAFLHAMHFGAEHISYSLFLRDALNLDFFSMGAYMAIAIFFMSFAAIFGGNITKKSNIVIIFSGSLLLSGIGHILMTNPDIGFSLFFRIVHEIGDALNAVAFLILFKDIFPRQRIGGDAGVFATVITLGSIVGSFLFSIIGFDYGHHWSLIISGSLTILGSLIFLSFYKTLKNK